MQPYEGKPFLFLYSVAEALYAVERGVPLPLKTRLSKKARRQTQLTSQSPLIDPVEAIFEPNHDHGVVLTAAASPEGFLLW